MSDQGVMADSPDSLPTRARISSNGNALEPEQESSSEDITAQESLPVGPPPPLLIVDRAPDVPALISVDTTSMSVQWSPVSITVQSKEIRVVEYLMAYALEMQQVDVDADSGAPHVREDHWSVQYSGPATYVQVKGLRPGRNYAVRVTCKPIVTDPFVMVQLAPASEIVLVRTPATPPSAPLSPTLAIRQRNSLKFKWAEPAENGGHPVLAYVFECHPPPEGHEGVPTAEGMFEMYRGLERNVLMKQLLPGVRYSVRVKAINCIGESPFSPAVAYSTQSSVPCTPEEPSVTESGPESVVLRWLPVAGNGAEVAGYQVEMDDGIGGEFSFVGHTSHPQFSVAGLRSGLAYRFRIRAENAEGRSLWSPVCTARTAATAPLAPAPPVKVSCTHGSIDVAWQPPGDDGGSAILKYEVEVHPKCPASLRDLPREWFRAYDGSELGCTLGGLRAGCTYRTRVRAVNKQGPGVYSFATDVSTAAAISEAPGCPAASSRSQDSLTVKWDAPQHDGGAAVTAYKLECRLVGAVEVSSSHAEESPFQTVYQGAERQAEVHNLQPGTKYEFRVAASNKQGTSSWSSPAVVETKPGLPLPPGVAEIAHGSAPRSLQLRWSPPSGRGAPVDSSIVQLHPLKAYTSTSSSGFPISTKVTSGEASNQEALPQANGHPSTSATGAASGSSTEAFTTVYHGSETCCTITDLEPDCEYVIRIRACNCVGASDWGQSQVARTSAAAPAVPESFSVTGTSKNSITLAWQPPQHDNGAQVSSYQVEFCPSGRGRSGTSSAWKVAFKGDSLTHEITELQPGHEYKARVRALNSCGWGPWTEAVVGATTADVPGAPNPVTTSSRGGTSVRVSWEPPLTDNGAAVTSYDLQMVAGDAADYATIYSGPDISYKATPLAYGTSYMFKARAVNEVGAGPWSIPVSVTTSLAPPVEPLNLAAACSEGDASTVIVTWEPPQQSSGHAQCTAFEIEATGAATKRSNTDRPGSRSIPDAKPSVLKQTCSGKVNEHRLTGLKPGVECSIRVRGIGSDGAGHGPWSAPVVANIPSTSASAVHRAMSDVPSSAASEEDEAPAIPRGQRHKKKASSSNSNIDDPAGRGAARVSGRGSRTLGVAKSKPRKQTCLLVLSKYLGMTETHVMASVYIMVFAMLVLALGVIMRIRCAAIKSSLPCTLGHVARSVVAINGTSSQSRVQCSLISPKYTRNFNARSSSGVAQRSTANQVDADFEAVVGIEMHVQLNTATKAFCNCRSEYGAEPNTNVCPVCLGHPGTLPALNAEMVRKGVLAGLALNCNIAMHSKFDRKQYFYADLPKGYQISQYDVPLCEHGSVEVVVPEAGVKKIGITRAHLEEDAGKLVYGGADSLSGSEYSLVDYNRGGVPLLEIVSEPDMRNGKEAAAYAAELRRIMRYLGVSDGNMAEGSMRCDVNISVRPHNREQFGTKVEIKNMNSFNAMQRAIEFEFDRQVTLLREGRDDEIVQETRLWDETKQCTKSMRKKEGLADYRYFPEPDLPALDLTQETVDELKASLPELPVDKRRRFLELGLSGYDALLLSDELDVADFYDAVLAEGADAKPAANWVMGDVMAYCKEERLAMGTLPMRPGTLASMISLIESNVISGKIGKEILPALLKGKAESGGVKAYVEGQGLVQISDVAEIEAIVDKVLSDNQSQLAEYRGGKTKLQGFFVGQVMKESKGRANPKELNRILMERLNGGA